MEPNEPVDPPSDADSLVCPHCIEPVERFDHFCPHCGHPITAHASIDPLGQVFSAGCAYQNATSSRPRLIVVLGIWLIFGPQIPFLIFGLSTIVSPQIVPDYVVLNEDGWLQQSVKVTGILGLLVIYATILWKVTSKFYNPPREQDT